MLVRPHVQRLVERARLRSAVPAGFVMACDRDTLQLALSGSFAGFLEPVLIGPEARIRDVAARAGLDISRFPIANTPDSPREAALCAVELARAGAVRILVKGSLGNDDLLVAVAASDSGLRTERRLSGAAFLDLPGHPRGLLLADPLLNIAPTLAAKKDIVRNTIELAVAIGIDEPHVAVLAAISAVSQAIPSTLDAVALKAMAEQGLFPGALVDGPLTVDVAVSPDLARASGSGGAVAGHADVLIAPGMEAASLLQKAMIALTGSFAATLVLGARVPVLLPGRLDSIEARMASCVLANLLASAKREDSTPATPASLAAPGESPARHASA